MIKRALITGCTGQDGSYLADLLLDKGYQVFGLMRRVSTPNIVNIEHLMGHPRFTIVDGDLTDLSSIIRALNMCEPHEVYNLAAQSFVGTSWSQPLLTASVTGLGALNVFEAVHQVCPSAKVYQASSSEMFPGSDKIEDENSVLQPRSVYGTAKLFAHHTARTYRESYGMFVSCGILFNHESPRRGIEFVTQKIVDTAVRQVVGGEDVVLKIGNVEACRDWSHAKDMVEGMWLMLQQNEPDDYVLASGEAHSVKEFADKVYGRLGVDLEWDVSDISGLPFACSKAGLLVQSVPEFYRPNEVNTLIGDSTKARDNLNWGPKFNFDSLVADMVNSKRLVYS
jgi:GDPmannose 4,6-dehydratase